MGTGTALLEDGREKVISVLWQIQNKSTGGIFGIKFKRRSWPTQPSMSWAWLEMAMFVHRSRG